MTEEQLSERIEAIVLDIDKVNCRGLYDAKQKLRQLQSDIAGELCSLREDRDYWQGEASLQLTERLSSIGEDAQ